MSILFITAILTSTKTFLSSLGSRGSSIFVAATSGFLDTFTLPVAGTLPSGKYWGWKVTGTTKSIPSFWSTSSPDSNRIPVLRLYGPKSGSSWGKQIAKVLTGGNVRPGTAVTEQHLLDLEKEGRFQCWY